MNILYEKFLVLGLCLCALVARAQAQGAAPASDQIPNGPELGPIILNEDGDFTFKGDTPEEWRANLSKMLDNLSLLPAQSLAYSLATGTDVLLYPSKAGSSWGWRPMEMPAKLKHMAAFPRAVQSGYDGLRWAAEDARRLGVAFVPVFRMNDAHYASGASPWMEGEFWTKYRKKYTFNTPPYAHPDLKFYKELLDYSHPEVREHRLGVMREAIDRYKDVMDGFLLDFMRVPMFFQLKEVPQKTPLMTELIRQVRLALDAAEKVRGHRIPLIVRVPPTIKNCETVGLDIRRWMALGIVQAVIPAQLMTLAQDSPVYEFVELAKPRGIKVYYSIYARTAYTYGFREKAPELRDYLKRRPDAALIRGATLNYKSMGVDGFELYNYNLPIASVEIPILQSLLGKADNLSKPRTYAVTQTYYFDHLDTYEPKKQVPFVLTDKQPIKTIGLYVGEDPAKILPESYVGLRLGFSYNDYETPPVHVRVNGVNISTGDDYSISKPTGKQTPRYYYQITIQKPGLILKQGWNTIQIYPRDPRNRLMPVMEVQLGVIPPATGAEASK